jgi:hypothetical protein
MMMTAVMTMKKTMTTVRRRVLLIQASALMSI